MRAMLHRERYRGKVPFGKHRKVVRAGARTRERQDEYLLTERPDLRIVDEALWQQVQARLRKQAAPTPSAPRIRESKYLLSGLLRCGRCGSSMLATSMVIGTPRTRRSVRRYACSWANSRGSTVCQNTVRPRMDDLDAAVIETIERQILTPAAVRRVIEFALEEARAELRTPPAQRDRRERELSKLRVELDRLIALVVGGKAPERVLAEIASREARIRELEREIQAVASESKSWNWQAMEGLIAQRAAHLRHVLHSETAAARSALVELLAEPMKFKPLGHREYEVSGLTRVGMLLETASEKSQKVASPRGFEPLLPP
ncbi:recombinase zinc beta ribbon domain-containing protein [Acidiferrobacter sp.]|uniref:recombinase zinc beta ribbon domain-containing protein n=1 Tax=Acidiferrobacter sp. TaxID=1872107 RepID=UPI00342819E9